MSTAELHRGGVSPELLERVENIVSQSLQDLPYLFARMTYGDELTLHFGAERGHDHPKLAGKARGTHVLSVRGSAWLLRSGVKRAMVGCGIASPGGTNPFNPSVWECGALIRQGARVKKATPLAVEAMNSIGLSLEFNDGSVFLVLPTSPSIEPDGLPEPADWEVLTPEKVLRVGPGPRYSQEDNSQVSF